MNETLRQFSEQLALQLKGKFSSEQTAEFIKTVKASGDDRSFEVVMSTSDEDRQGDALDQSKWDLKYFEMNPVVLWAHDYSSFPIGVVEDIRIDGDKAIATGKFAPAGVNPEADMACALYQEKILKTVSPGYIQNDDGTRELLEMSFCPVPAGRYALSLRQVGRLKVSTRELVAKGFFYEEKKPKESQVGEPCELEDGSPGVLAEDANDPGKLICVPTENKSNESNETKDMNELEKKIKAEHERHGMEVGKAIDAFGEKCLKGEKAEGHLDKAIEELSKTMEGEQETHLEKCMKAIDEGYELQDQAKKQLKSIDEFKAEMTDEHLNHVKKCDKAIDEFKAEPGYSEEEKKKAIDEFTKAMGAELDRHEKCHMDMVKAEGETEETKAAKKMGAVAEELAGDEVRQAKYQKLDRAYDVFYAFTSAYMEDDVTVDQFDTLLDEAVSLMKDLEGKAKTAVLVKAIENKAGRAISAKTKEKIESIIKTIEDYHGQHTADHEKSTNDVTAALKAIIASGDGGEETKPDEKSDAAPKPRSSTSGAKAELEIYLFNQRLARQVKTAAETVLRQVNPKIRELTSRGR